MTRKSNKNPPAKTLRQRGKNLPAKRHLQRHKNPLVSFESPGAQVQASLEESGRDFLSHNPFIRKQPMKVSLAPLPAPDESPDEADERENPMHPWVRTGIEVVGGSLGGWLVSYLAASAVTSIANGENPSPTLIRAVSYGSAVAPALVFAVFPRNPSAWKGALAGASLYPLIERLIGSFQAPSVTP
jgi:hypothetical protein